MKVVVRPYRHSDYDEICSWWKDQGGVPPKPGMMVEQGTFVLELDGTPTMTVTALLTQSKHVSFLEGYCAKPGLVKSLRNALGKALWDEALKYLRQNGVTRVNIFTDNVKLVKRYEDLGMHLQMEGLASLGMEV